MISKTSQLQIPDEILEEIVEGETKLVVPKRSITDKVPPKKPAFFNPKAKLTRDMSIVAYSAFLNKFRGPRVFLEGFSGVGARGLRVAKEIEMEKVVINDLNPTALKLARDAAKKNGLECIEFSENEICRFFSDYSKKGKRGSIVDVDPFGSPAQFFDCGIRATMHGGILSVTATDLQVLNGLFQDACKRKYGGIPIRVNYGNEIAIRLILGCMNMVTGRLGVKMIPVFVENDMHYYRTYVKILNRVDQQDNLGYITHCNTCGNRKTTCEPTQNCNLCGSLNKIAGPLWIGQVFDKEFVDDMLQEIPNLIVDKKCQNTLLKCLAESEMPGTYFTLDEIASQTKTSPPKLENILDRLKKMGFTASPTVFSPTGFRTTANIEQIKKMFLSN